MAVSLVVGAIALTLAAAIIWRVRQSIDRFDTDHTDWNDYV